ncbi:TetR/AcrR family transcriptional regulator [Salinisphaera sp. Q1T1-3]|uniref:TetR/AcrR family transcriptional regulator n=1 Tax=Salinisphaera sp. Q1T1-3 TaxID=2321229 RepID=UPI0013143656|nr:TetR/AcrR family transcriptional regulator [Salinisphaera sp. Q1T1-3]
MSDINRRSTAERIHDTALSLFASQGYEGTSLSQLAEAVGIRKPSLYNHIESKEALFMSLVDEVEHAFFAELDASVAAHRDADTETRTFALVSALSRFILEADQGTFHKRYLLFPPRPLLEQVRQITARAEARIDVALRTFYAQGRDEGLWQTLSEREFLDAFYVLVDGLFTERFLYSVDEYDRRVQSVWPIFWAGLSR